MTSIMAASTALSLALITLGAPIAYDGFNNGPLADLNGAAGGTGWTSPWTDLGSSQLTSVGGAGLTWPTLPASVGFARPPPGR